MHRAVLFLLVGLIAIEIFLIPAFAQEYVLPYPGFMPGNPLYKISQFVDRVEEVWSFGNFAKFSYYLGLSDKKLIEAKILFEYKQYLLGFEALQMSDRYFGNAFLYLSSAQREGKNISQKQKILAKAAEKHIETLFFIRTQVPKEFVWQPEKASPTVLELEKIIDKSTQVRNNNANYE